MSFIEEGATIVVIVQIKDPGKIQNTRFVVENHFTILYYKKDQ